MLALFASVLLAPTAYGWKSVPRDVNLQDARGEFDRETVVRAGPVSGSGWAANFGFSLDGGASWRPPFARPPEGGAGEGHVAVSADGATWVWSLSEGAYRTENYGVAWTPSAGLRPGLRVVADRTSPNRFYALDLARGTFYASEDGGKSFVPRELGFSTPAGNAGEIYPTPGRAGDFWVASSGGLYHAAPARRFERLPGVESVRAFGFGQAAPATPLPDAVAKAIRALGLGEVARVEVPSALYLLGTIEGEQGVFRSDDGGGRWTRIGMDAPDRHPLAPFIQGDPKRYGRVYVLDAGGQAFLGDPVAARR